MKNIEYGCKHRLRYSESLSGCFPAGILRIAEVLPETICDRRDSLLKACSDYPHMSGDDGYDGAPWSGRRYMVPLHRKDREGRIDERIMVIHEIFSFAELPLKI